MQKTEPTGMPLQISQYLIQYKDTVDQKLQKD